MPKSTSKFEPIESSVISTVLIPLESHLHSIHKRTILTHGFFLPSSPKTLIFFLLLLRPIILIAKYEVNTVNCSFINIIALISIKLNLGSTQVIIFRSHHRLSPVPPKTLIGKLSCFRHSAKESKSDKKLLPTHYDIFIVSTCYLCI